MAARFCGSSSGLQEARVTVGVEAGRTVADKGREAEPTAGTDPLDEVFQDLRQRVSKASGVEDVAEQHYLLGAECARTGRYDQAKTALEVAVDSPRYQFRAGAMLGRIYLEEGRAAEAVEWFERAAAVSPPTSEEGYTLLYHLGTTLEGLEEWTRALAVFLEIKARAGDHRDVWDRIARLSRTLLGG